MKISLHLGYVAHHMAIENRIQALLGDTTIKPKKLQRSAQMVNSQPEKSIERLPQESSTIPIRIQRRSDESPYTSPLENTEGTDSPGAQKSSIEGIDSVPMRFREGYSSW